MPPGVQVQPKKRKAIEFVVLYQNMVIFDPVYFEKYKAFNNNLNRYSLKTFAILKNIWYNIIKYRRRQHMQWRKLWKKCCDEVEFAEKLNTLPPEEQCRQLSLIAAEDRQCGRKLFLTANPIVNI